MGSLRWISPSCYTSPGNLRVELFGSNCCKLGVNRTKSRCRLKSASLPSRMPWLMLPPVSEDGDMVYEFYDPLKDDIRRFKKREEGVDLDQLPPDDAKFVGSSHGWVASFDENSNHVFLSNPISHRHIKLPPINTLPDPDINLFDGRGSISRVILSSSPDEAECRAVTTFGPGGRLAYCQPGVSTEWTPLGGAFAHFREEEEEGVMFALPPYEDFVICSRRKVLTSITPCRFDLDALEMDLDKHSDQLCQIVDWNIPDPQFRNLKLFSTLEPWGERENEDLELLNRRCIQMPHIVYAEQLSDEPLVVLRFVDRGIGDNDSPSDPKLARPDFYRALINTFPYRSVGFLVIKVIDDGFFCEVVEDLNGLAIFVGMNHSFAIPAAGILKPNSIYFTDACRLTPPDPDARKIYGGHDIGIFDYENKTVSPFYNYPCDFQSFKRIEPSPMWFTPSANL